MSGCEAHPAPRPPPAPPPHEPRRCAMIARTVEEATAELASRGYVPIDGIDGIAVGVRVRNYGEQYLEARRHGTAVVRAVMERDPSSWSHSHGRRDVEVVVERDRPGFVGVIAVWADYGTRVVTR